MAALAIICIARRLPGVESIPFGATIFAVTLAGWVFLIQGCHPVGSTPVRDPRLAGLHLVAGPWRAVAAGRAFVLVPPIPWQARFH